jgi:hypothetical protein
MPVDLFDLVRGTFGDGNLLRAPREIVMPLRLPPLSKEYLIQVGLPGNDVPPGINFNLADRLPKLGELYPAYGASLHPSWEHARLLRLKDDVGVYFDEDDGGTVWELDVVPSLDSRFINDGVELLGYFLAEFNCLSETPVKRSPDDSREAFVHMRERMRAADAKAFADADYFWPLVLEDEELFFES